MGVSVVVAVRWDVKIFELTVVQTDPLQDRGKNRVRLSPQSRVLPLH